jgi:hypothetical protein
MGGEEACKITYEIVAKEKTMKEKRMFDPVSLQKSARIELSAVFVAACCYVLLFPYVMIMHGGSCGLGLAWIGLCSTLPRSRVGLAVYCERRKNIIATKRVDVRKSTLGSWYLTNALCSSCCRYVVTWLRLRANSFVELGTM